MIALAADCLVFRLNNGESVPFSAEMISVELMGDTAGWFDPEFVSHAAKAVFHYFKQELGWQTVTVGEFSGALEKVLRGFRPSEPEAGPVRKGPEVVESDLCRLAQESGAGCELIFFPRLRDELRQRMQQNPKVLRFRGLRPCVKELTGLQRWSPRCQDLQDQIVAFLRQCLGVEPKPGEFALVVQ